MTAEDDRRFEEIVADLRLRESFEANTNLVTEQALDLAASNADPVKTFGALVLVRFGTLMDEDPEARDQAALAVAELLAASLLLNAHYLRDPKP